MTENEAIEYLLNKYLVVGSPVNPPKEECEKHNAALDMAIKALGEMQKIKKLGSCYIIPKNGVWEVNGIDVNKAIEKQISQKPIFKNTDEKTLYICPCCRNVFVEEYDTVKRGYIPKYCDRCGQKID